MPDYTELAKFGVVRPETPQPADPLDKFGTPAKLMNLGRLRQYLDDVTIADLSRAHLYIAEDFVQYTDDVDPGLDGFKACFEAFTPIAPDLKVVSTCIVAGTHHVGAIWTGYGHYPYTGDKFVLPNRGRVPHGAREAHRALGVGGRRTRSGSSASTRRTCCACSDAGALTRRLRPASGGGRRAVAGAPGASWRGAGGGDGGAAATVAADDAGLAAAVGAAERVLVDVGCGDGRHTLRWAERSRPRWWSAWTRRPPGWTAP